MGGIAFLVVEGRGVKLPRAAMDVSDGRHGRSDRLVQVVVKVTVVSVTGGFAVEERHQLREQM